VQDPYPPISDRYSSELSKLVESTLTKDDSKRPTVSEILDTPFLEKYMVKFIKEREDAAKKRKFEDLAGATALKGYTIPKVDPTKKINHTASKFKTQEGKPQSKPQELTAKQKMLLRKEEERKKQFDVMSSGAKMAGQTLKE
jgi:serine/threonine protein kinase